VLSAGKETLNSGCGSLWAWRVQEMNNMPQRPHLPPIEVSGRLVLQQAVLLLHTGFACKRTSGRSGYEEVMKRCAAGWEG
jgi:hypothetical protein